MNNTNETGRSMVEMLGVLAIIGVLSIGGIAGYTQAMRRYRANEILNAISMLAVTAKTRTSTESVGYLEAYPGSTKMTGLQSLDKTDFYATIDPTDGKVNVYVTFDSEPDCNAVKSMVNGTSLMAWKSTTACTKGGKMQIEVS